MLLHAFPSMSVSSLREFPENRVYKHDGLNCFVEYLHIKLLLLPILSVLINIDHYMAFLMIYERGLIKGMLWKMTCYEMPFSPDIPRV
jgi:hypothetical protein